MDQNVFSSFFITFCTLQVRNVDGKIYAFGSSVNGFGDQNSDVDLVVAVDEERIRDWLGSGNRHIYYTIHYKNVEKQKHVATQSMK